MIAAKEQVRSKLLDFPQFAPTFLRVRTKDMRLRPFWLNRVQADLHRRIGKRALIVKPRQVGVSTYVLGRGFHDNITRTSSSITIADTDANTKTLRRIYNRFYEYWPDEVVGRPERAKDSEAVVTYPATGSESVIITSGSKTAGHGATYSFVHGSEVAHWPDPENVFARALQGATPDAQIVLESTPNGAQGLFYELCLRALDGDSDWSLFFYPWWWADEYSLPLSGQPAFVYSEDEQRVMALAAQDGFTLTPGQILWRRNKQRELGALFAQEYPETMADAFLLSGQGVFRNLDACVYGPLPDAPPNVSTVGGIDWGQSEDYTVLVVMDPATGKVVGLDRFNRLPWQMQRDRVKAMTERYHVGVWLAELNSIGSVNVEALQAEGLPVEGFMTTAASKPELIRALALGFEQGAISIPDDAHLLRELRAFTARQTAGGHWQYQASAGSHDDCVIGVALAYCAATRPVFSMDFV